MSDQIDVLLDVLEATIKLLRFRENQLKEELDRVAELQTKLHRQWALNNKLLNERNALRNKLALIETDDRLTESYPIE